MYFSLADLRPGTERRAVGEEGVGRGLAEPRDDRKTGEELEARLASVLRETG